MAAPIKSREHKAFGDALRSLREDRKLSQEQLGYDTELHRNYIGRMERGELNFSFDRLLRVANALEVPPSELMAQFEEELARAKRRSSRKL